MIHINGVNVSEPGYKVYSALIIQSGITAPTVQILKNTLGSIVWTRDDAGEYTATLVGAFTDAKTEIFISMKEAGIEGGGTRLTADTLYVSTSESDGTYADGKFGTSFSNECSTIEIRVYY